jgi:hypothetical protein
MGRAQAHTKSSDGFTNVFGRGRGISEEENAQREEARRLAIRPRAFVTKTPLTITTSYFLDNDPLRAILHREDGPALVVTTLSGRVISEAWHRRGQAHREDGPAYLSYDDEGALIDIYYLLNGQLNRADGPACVHAESGEVRFEEWNNGRGHHRIGGPAITKVAADGTVTESYYVEDRLHREDGPAIIYRNAAGEITASEHWLEGKLIGAGDEHGKHRTLPTGLTLL